MRKNIKIGEREVPFEANLGTARLYQKLTGDDLFKTIVTKGKQKDTDAALDVFDIYQKLAYVMNMQATSEGIREMLNKMTEEDFLEWTFQFEQSDLTETVLIEIGNLWSSQTTNKSELKNA